MKSKTAIRVFFLIFAVLAALGVWYGARQYHSKSVALNDCGTLRLPDAWESTEQDGLLTISDEEGKTVMVQYVYTETEKYPTEYGTVRTILGGGETNAALQVAHSTIYSNSATYGEGQITADGVVQNVRIIELYGYDQNRQANNICFYCADDLSEFSLRQIAKSFRHN